MLPDSKIALLIGSQVPGIFFPAEQQISKVISTFASYTGRMIRYEHLNEVKRCFTMAGVLYKNGSNALRNAIEGAFIFTLSPLINKQHQAMLPLSLRHIRLQQLQTI
ncbi:hypothetical protein DVR12_11010 [Chitinophaga silvatica]|uniref:DUF7674 domain-containing protein n=1 Tax=Chitinophaga silvatica TaxID=2282649 RepID=A0A3E1YBY0_9BACT|nr:hypothetical protein [Chitinophaga silvatica]RFS23535.1 hypothetical protein DVR12_11010 [Chitinophaga silvatica]